MKIVFDTNVILSAFLTEGITHRVFNDCVINHEIYISEFIVNELKRVLIRKFDVKAEDIKEFTNFIDSNLNSVKPVNVMPNICRDETDNNILQLADFVKADIIISGDKDLLTLKQFKEIKIISSRDYFNEYLVNGS